MARGRTNPDFLNGVPELVLLRLLHTEEMYGYQLARRVREGSGEVLTMGEGVLYPVLHGLEDDGFVASRTETVEGRPRVYYRLTPAGRVRLKEQTVAWQRVSGAVAAVLGTAGKGAVRAHPAR